MHWKHYAALLLCPIIAFTSFAGDDPVRLLERQLSHRADTAEVNLLNKLSWQYRHINIQKAHYYGEKALKMARKIRYWNGLAYAHKNQGNAYSSESDYSKADEHLSKALFQFTELNNRIEIGNIHNLMGLNQWERGNYDSALVCYNTAMKEFRLVNDEEGKAIIYSNKGIIYYELAKYDQAIENYLYSLRIARRINYTDILASANLNVGIVYSAMGNTKKALFHYKQSMLYDQNADQFATRARIFTNIGVCYFNLQQTDSSLHYHEKALKIYRMTGDKKGISHSLMNIGSIYHVRKDYSKANEHFLSGLEMNRADDNKLGQIIALNSLGKLLAEQEKNDQAIDYLLAGYDLALQIRSLRYQVETSLLLAQLYENTGDHRRSSQFYGIYAKANTQLMRELTSEKLTDLQVAIATQEQQEKISSLQQSSKISTQQKGWLLAGTILAIVAGIVTLLLVRKKHRKETETLEHELMINQSALQEYTRHLLEKNTMIESLQLQLDETTEHSPFHDPRIEQLNELSTARIITDDDWEEFKRRFVLVYPVFMIRMKERFHGITPAELRLASLIVLQLPSRSIASMLGISTESVKKARQRLRKKMELLPEQDLDKYLVEFAN
ncbi:MAG TPA: tetratricopeptide repeat protein [Fluviicola sp.]|nr:tetratricopeptide repeat protein [Fluviicola sp.]